jgi:hypothetical protein
VRFSVEYPDRELSRLTTAFRVIVAIPILIVAASLGGYEGGYAGGGQGWRIAGGTAGLLFLGPLLMILFRQKYPAGGSTGTASCSGSRTGSASISH